MSIKSDSIRVNLVFYGGILENRIGFYGLSNRILDIFAQPQEIMLKKILDEKSQKSGIFPVDFWENEIFLKLFLKNRLTFCEIKHILCELSSWERKKKKNSTPEILRFTG